jgi:hypothetical protein
MHTPTPERERERERERVRERERDGKRVRLLIIEVILVIDYTHLIDGDAHRYDLDIRIISDVDPNAFALLYTPIYYLASVNTFV